MDWRDYCRRFASRFRHLAYQMTMPSQPSDFDTSLLKDVSVSRDIRLAHPKLAAMFKELEESYARMFPTRQVIVTCSFRSPQEQQRLYKQGRFGNSGAIVTNCDGISRLSEHNKFPARAIDVAISEGGKIVWDEAVFYPLGNLAREVGLSWGGFWTKCVSCHREPEAHKVIKDHAYSSFRDLPHLELPRNID